MDSLEYDQCSAKSRSVFFKKLENRQVIFKVMETWGAMYHLKKILLDKAFQEESQKNLQFCWNK